MRVIVTPVTNTPVRVRAQEVSAVALSPSEHSMMAMHNGRIGPPLQRTVMRFLIVYLTGLFGFLLLRLFFRLEIAHAERMRAYRKRSVIFALRHFYEADPFVTFSATAYLTSLTAPHLAAWSLASRIWTRTPVMRSISWCFGVMGLSRGLGVKQSATDRAVQLLRSESRAAVAIYPTGPVGRRRDYSVGPGIGYLAVHCPDVQVQPITMKGLAEARLKDLLLFRRPRLQVSLCRPFSGRDLAGRNADDRIEHACTLVRERWQEEEARMAEG